MTRVILVFFLFLNLSVSAQSVESGSNTSSTLFAQGLFSIETKEAMLALENEIRQNPHVQVVRLDWPTQRLFILTNNLSDLSEAELISWFGNYSDSIWCVQIGVYGVDPINSYPFNCVD